MTSVNATSSTDAARQALIRGMLASGIGVNTMMPSDNAEDATRSFRFATDKDPSMCDAWLGRILTGEDSVKVLYGAWNARDTFGWEIRRLGVVPSKFVPKVFDGLFLNVQITSPDSLGAAYGTVLSRSGRYADADKVLSALAPSDAFDADLVTYALGVLHFRAGRWADVHRLFPAEKVWRIPAYGAVAAAMATTALASLGVFEDAFRRAQGAIDDDVVPHAATIALYTQGMCLRHLGRQDDASQLLRRVYARDPQFAPAREALDDPRRQLSLTTPEMIEGRTDPWDPSTETTPEMVAAEQHADLLAEAEKMLDKQIGLHDVKRQIQTLKATEKINAVRVQRGRSPIVRSHHMVFGGPPGTGKTTIARVVAYIYCGLGILEKPTVVEARRADLVATHLGQTAPKTEAKIDEAMGGILFIDEAYSLIQEGLSGGDAFGQEAIDTLLARMENDRDKFVVIIAGYMNELDRLLESNDGLASRFRRRINFPSYSPEELGDIAASMVTDNESAIDEEAIGILKAVCAYLEPQKWPSVESNGKPGKLRPALDVAGNGRFVRNVVEASFEALAERLIEDHGGDIEDVDDTMLTTITARDIAASVTRLLEDTAPSTESDIGNAIASLTAGHPPEETEIGSSSTIEEIGGAHASLVGQDQPPL